MVTCGFVYPVPAVSTVMPVTDPVGVNAAVAVALVLFPAESVIVTAGGAVYPLPGSVMVMPVMAPFAPTEAVAVACVPEAGGSMVTIASESVNGLLAQFGYGPK